MYLYLDGIESLGFYSTKGTLETNRHNDWPFEPKKTGSFHRKFTSALMRNLSILSSSRWFLDGNSLPTAIAFDLEADAWSPDDALLILATGGGFAFDIYWCSISRLLSGWETGRNVE